MVDLYICLKSQLKASCVECKYFIKTIKYFILYHGIFHSWIVTAAGWKWGNKIDLCTKSRYSQFSCKQEYFLGLLMRYMWRVSLVEILAVLWDILGSCCNEKEKKIFCQLVVKIFEDLDWIWWTPQSSCSSGRFIKLLMHLLQLKRK